MTTIYEVGQRADDGVPAKDEVTVELQRKIRAFARNDVRVLFHGASGSGKDFMTRHYARAFADAHPERSDNYFATVNCAWYAEANTALSELFGVKKSVFTDVDGRLGMLQICRGGILFLDEVGDLPVQAQPMLLRALSAGKGCPIGGDPEDEYDIYPITILSATDQPLENIREALLHRLGQQLYVPSLYERPEEICLSVVHFARRGLRKNRDVPETLFFEDLLEECRNSREAAIHKLAEAIGKKIEKFAMKSKWPGNFRSLRMAMEGLDHDPGQLMAG